MEIFDDDLDILEIVENGFPRQIYERAEYFDEMDNLTFFKRFRLRKPTVLAVLEQIEEHIEYPTDRNMSITPINQLLGTLRFFATGGHLSSIADFMGMDIATASRIVKRVSIALANLTQTYVNMPNHEEIVSVQSKFFQVASFPRIVGCVDGTHIRIQSPEVFRNRKGFFSINTQIVGDADLKIRDIVARWPGSTHDQTIFVNSRLRATFENGTIRNSVLLGDSGYALKNYLLTPLAQPITIPEQLYNESHIRTRNIIERIIGIWKRRFPVLAYGLRLKLDTVLAVIPATSVLHNIARNSNEDEPPVEGNEEELNYLIEMGNVPDVPYQAGVDPVAEIINYFRNINNV